MEKNAQFVYFAVYDYNGHVEEEETGKACRKNVEERNAYRILMGSKKERGRWEDLVYLVTLYIDTQHVTILKWMLQIGYSGKEWINITPYRK
jgi:hypothetical protein